MNVTDQQKTMSDFADSMGDIIKKALCCTPDELEQKVRECQPTIERIVKTLSS